MRYLVLLIAIVLTLMVCSPVFAQNQMQGMPHRVYIGMTAFVYTGDPIKVLLHPQAPETRGDGNPCVGKAQVHSFQIVRLEGMKVVHEVSPYTLGEYMELPSIPMIGHYATRWQCIPDGRWYPSFAESTGAVQTNGLPILDGDGQTIFVIYAELRPPTGGTIGP